jgi:hypothetical protein
MTSGDAVSWSYDLPTGATADCEFWYDANGNGTIESGTDVNRFFFTQTDGDTNGNGGPPDTDGEVNGAVSFSQPVGFGPGKYVFKVTHNGSGSSIPGEVLALPSPAHTISGHITPPAGKSAQYIDVELHRNDQFGNPNFWDAYTDASGNYSIQMNADTAGNPWRIRIEKNPYPPSVITPSEIEITITGNHSGNDFSFIESAAQVVGIIRDDNGNTLPDASVQIRRNDGGAEHRETSDASGFFQIGLQLGELTDQTWDLQTDCRCENGVTQDILSAQVRLPVINANDSLYRELTVYNANSQIHGEVRVNGGVPDYSIQIIASSVDTAYAQALSDSADGSFIINVSDKIHEYALFASFLPFGWSQENVVAHAGDNGVIINISTQANALIQWNNGWNMLSVPVRVDDKRKTSLFPSAGSSAFNYTTTGYHAEDTLYNGIGYWLKFNGSNSTSMNGYYIPRETVYVVAGWNLIGSISDSASTGNVLGIGTSVISPYFGYTPSGYTATTTLYPGSGYWAKVSTDGRLVLKSGTSTESQQANGRNDIHFSTASLRNCNQLIVRDAAGSERTLYFSPRKNIDLREFELPPPPPAGIMDVRFSSNRMVECPDADNEKSVPLRLSSAQYPLTISWKINDQPGVAWLFIDGRKISLRQDGSTNIEHRISNISLSLSSSTNDPRGENDLPRDFALEQNYPNPFNPTTVFPFQLPVSSFVTLNVYNVLGQEVAALVNGVLQAGSHASTWDANGYPSGVYYYKLTAGEFRTVKKLVLGK